MSKKIKYKSLVIVGNGFDLAHGYRTTFGDFVERTKSEGLEAFRRYCDYQGIATWYQFEENISIITRKIYENNFYDGADPDELEKAIVEINDCFASIHKLLVSYLRGAEKEVPFQKINNVKKYIKRKSKVVNFNYTNIAENYTKDIFYIHGSLKENDIIIGYDYRHEPCLMGMQHMYWYKRFRRESLAYKRYLNEGQGINGEDYDKKIEDFEKYQMCVNAGRGIDEELENEITDFKGIHSFVCDECEKRMIPDIDYSKIKTVTVIGHGIEADGVLLDEMLKKCRRIKKITVFRYKQETDDAFDIKVKFLKRYCKKIACKYY